MDSNRIMLANSLFFAAIVAVAVWIIREERTIPMRPDIESITSPEAAGGSGSAAAADEYNNLGRRQLFATLIPRPSPTLSPSPTPPPPPPIDKVLQYWKLLGVLDGLAFFQDVKENVDFTMDLKDNRMRSVRFQNMNVNVYLESASLRTMIAVVRIEEMGETQKYEFDLNKQ